MRLALTAVCTLGVGCADRPSDPVPFVALSGIQRTAVAASECAGGFESARPRGDEISVSGWAWDLAANAAPDLVILLNEEGDQVGAARVGPVSKKTSEAPPRAVWAGVARSDAGQTRAFVLLRDGALCPVGARTL